MIPTEEQQGTAAFDLDKARAVCKTLPKYMNGACPCKEEAEAAKMLIKALPEIRRLQEFRDRVARILKQPLTDCDDLLILGLDARLCQLRRQAAEIERLQLELTQALKDLSSKDEIIEKLKKEFLKSTYEHNKIRHGHAWYPGDEDYNEYLQRIDADAHKKSRESLDDVLRGN